jgi:hypothetical protein
MLVYNDEVIGYFMRPRKLRSVIRKRDSGIKISVCWTAMDETNI